MSYGKERTAWGWIVLVLAVVIVVLPLVVVADSHTGAARVVGVLGLVAGAADVLALVVVISDGVILGVVGALLLVLYASARVVFG